MNPWDKRRVVDVPEVWAQEVAERTAPHLFAEEPRMDLTLRLAIGPALWTRVIQAGIDWSAVNQDVGDGVRFERAKRDGSDPYYVLTAREHKVYLQSGKGRDTEVPLAMVTSVKPVQGLRQRQGLHRITVQLADLSDEPECDLEAAFAAWSAHLATLEARDDVLRQARSELVEPGSQVTDPGSDLHKLVRRSHGALRTLIALFQERARREGTRLLDAIVLETPPGEDEEIETEAPVRLKLAEPRGLSERDMVELILSGDEGTGRIGKVVELVGDGEFLVRMPADEAYLRPGEAIRLKRLPRPHLRAHKFALEDFFGERVQGRWMDLARLLTCPQDLTEFRMRPPPTWFCDEAPADRPLNEDQREAVVGALSTPHTFFIQGPPGTGKTTVIVELIRQLVARGERVLLLAPTHVAVDEVLERVQESPEIWPLRMSWDEGKVRPAVRPFVQRVAASSLAGKLRRPETSQARRWRQAGERAATRAAPYAGNRDHAARVEVEERYAAQRSALEAEFRRRVVYEPDQVDALESLLADRIDELDLERLQAHMALDNMSSTRGNTGGAQTAAAVEDRSAPQLPEHEELAALEQLWFEISGLGDPKQERAQDDIAGEIGDELIRAANLVCATTAGIAGAQLVRHVDFDTLIVDEASRVTDAEFLIGAVRARRWILVGDEKQLPPHVEPRDEHYLHALHALHLLQKQKAGTLEEAVESLGSIWTEEEELHRFRHNEVLARARALAAEPELAHDLDTLGEAMDHLKGAEDPQRALLQVLRDQMVRSLFERGVTSCKAGLRRRLVVQRRMIPRLARLVAEPVYGGDYRSPSEAELARVGVTPLATATFKEPLVFLDTVAQGRRARDTLVGSGFVNELERQWVVRACEIIDHELAEAGIADVTVSVLAFYRQQALELRKELGFPACATFRCLRFQVIDAIDKIQGQESDIVFVSFCRRWSNPQHPPRPGYGLWLQDARRLNVAFTRAHRALFLVGHSPTLAGLSGAPDAERFYLNLKAELESGSALILKDLR